MRYEHLSLEEREDISRMRFEGALRSEIALEVGRDKSTVSRELRRNGGAGREYQPHRAHAAAARRRREAKRPVRMAHAPLAAYARRKLEASWSPEQIAGRLLIDFPPDAKMRVSHETIYRWIRQDKQEGGTLYTRLRQGHRKRRKRYGSKEMRGSIPGRVGIEHRPEVVGERGRFGDWESDTMEGALHRGHIATHVERKSRFLVAAKLADKRAATYARRTVRAFRRVPDTPMETMTVDNGKEFAAFKKLEKRLGVAVYFARPYHAWERGLNENTNGLLRQFFPKGMDLRGVSQKTLDGVVDRINNRPRKGLDYRTPVEVLRRGGAVALQS